MVVEEFSTKKGKMGEEKGLYCSSFLLLLGWEGEALSIFHKALEFWEVEEEAGGSFWDWERSCHRKEGAEFSFYTSKAFAFNV